MFADREDDHRGPDEVDRTVEAPPPPVDAASPSRDTRSSAHLPFTHLRHYEIEGILGRGGMGVVFLARDRHLGRNVAIKSLPPALASDERRALAFQEEARHLASLTHPHIGAIHGIEIVDGTPHLILEYIAGGSLAERITRGALSVEETVRLGAQIAAALAAAHERSIVHRDLKPSNILLTTEGDAKVLDFGLAVTRTGRSPARELGGLSGGSSTVRPPLAGTPRYMSPEQVRGEEVDAATDIWALGCVLFEMLAGRPAYELGGLHELDRILTESPRFEWLPDELPENLSAIVRACFSHDPIGRPRSMEELSALLFDLRGTRDIEAEHRLTGRWHLVRPTVRAGESLQLRLHLRNRGRVAEDLEITVDAGADAEALRPLPHAAPIARTIRPGSAGGAIFSFLPRCPGTLALPAVTVRAVDDPSRVERIEAVPDEVTVLDPSPDLSGVFASILGRLPSADRAVGEAGRLVRVIGEEGSGRALLCREVRKTLERSGFRVLRGFAPIGRRAERKVFRDLLRDLLGIDEREHTEASLRAFAAQRLDELLGATAGATPFFLDLLLSPGHASGTAETESHRFAQLFIAAAREAPLALVIENLTEADPESMTLLSSLLSRFAEAETPVIAFATGRVDPLSSLEDSPAELDGGWSRDAIAIPRLDRDSVATLIEDRYSGARHADEVPTLADGLLERTDGRIGLVVDLVERLGSPDEEIVLFRRASDGERWITASEVDPTPILDRGARDAAAIESWIAEVAAEHRPVLEYASWIGVEVPVSVLERLGIEGEILDEALDALERAGIALPTDPELTQYRFTRVQIPEWVRARVERAGSRAAARRKKKLVEALVAEFGDDPDATEWLGRTLLSLGAAREGIAALLRALLRHNDRSRYDSAHSLLPLIGAALEKHGVEGPEQQLRWKLERAKTLIARSHSAAALEATVEARRLAEELGDADGRARSLVLRARVDTDLGDFDAAEERLRRAERLAVELGDRSLALDACNNRAIIERRRGDLLAARALLEPNLAGYHALGDREGEAKTAVNLGVVLNALDEGESARAMFETARTIAHELGQLEFETQALVWLCNLDYADGQFERARRGYTTAIENFRAIQNRRALGRNYFNLAQVERLLGRLDLAVTPLDRALEIARRSGFRDDEQRASIELAIHVAQCGDLARARTALEIAEACVDAPGSPFSARAIAARAAVLLPDAPLPEGIAIDPIDLAIGAWGADTESAAWGALAVLLRLDEPATEPDRIVPALAIVRALIGTDSNELALRLLVEVDRLFPDLPDLTPLHEAISTACGEGPPGFGRDLCHRWSARRGPSEERARTLLFAEADLAHWGNRIDDPALRARALAVRRTLHDRIVVDRTKRALPGSTRNRGSSP